VDPVSAARSRAVAWHSARRCLGCRSREQHRTVDTHVKRLREKLGTAGDYVRDRAWVGYRSRPSRGWVVKLGIRAKLFAASLPSSWSRWPLVSCICGRPSRAIWWRAFAPTCRLACPGRGAGTNPGRDGRDDECRMGRPGRSPGSAGTCARDFIDGQGVVKGDSELSGPALEQVENHRNRPEVKAALPVKAPTDPVFRYAPAALVVRGHAGSGRGRYGGAAEPAAGGGRPGRSRASHHSHCRRLVALLAAVMMSAVRRAPVACAPRVTSSPPHVCGRARSAQPPRHSRRGR